MIIYDSTYFGYHSLTRVNGSPTYKVFLPTMLSTGMLVIYYQYAKLTQLDQKNLRVVSQPYVVEVLVVFFTLLLTFRLNFAYSRYWEATTAVHQMVSRWLDLAVSLAAFHYQSKIFNDIRPLCLGNLDKWSPNSSQQGGMDQDDEIDTKRLLRRREFGMTAEDLLAKVAQEEELIERRSRTWKNFFRRSKIPNNKACPDDIRPNVIKRSINAMPSTLSSHESTIPIPLRFQEQFTLTTDKLVGDAASPGICGASGRQNLLTRRAAASLDLFANHRARVPAPSAFLQEAGHVVSVMVAVALSTLRNDIEGTDSPIVEYIPGEPWPEIDPDKLDMDIKQAYGEDNLLWKWIYFCLGLSRSERHRALYNAARPFEVLGGVSDEEVELLQRARGPEAKVALCTFWVQEFISRETLAGSTGDVGAPILSNLYQFLSDGFLGFNNARKVAYVPFPFPHAQTAAFFTVVIIFVFPLLYISYVDLFWFACVGNSFTVLCLLGLHEVARELEDPFFSAPNDLPLNFFNSQFNEALVTIYAGFHPDSVWPSHNITGSSQEEKDCL